MSGNGEPVVAEEGSQQQPEQEQEPSYGSQFLSNVADEDKPYVEKYLKDWDQGVSQRFQKLHDEYKPYKDLGNPEELQEAIRISKVLDENPELVLEILTAELGKTQQQQLPPGSTVEVNKNIPSHFEGMTPEQIEYFSKLEKMIENTAQLSLGQQERVKQEQEDQALASELKRLHDVHGEFDEEYILTKMYHGKSGDQAVKEFLDFKQNLINGQAKPKPQPPSLLGGGPIPAGQKNVTDMNKEETTSLVAKLLENAAKGQD